MGNNNGKRLFQYALHYKRPILMALVLLLLAVGVELVGPFLAKRMIDTNIMGIEKPWYETKQERNTRSPTETAGISGRTTGAAGETKGREVRVLQADNVFYFVDAANVPDTGKRSFSDGG